MVPTAELAPLEPSKGFVEENGVAWPQAAPVHVKTKSAWATNSARGAKFPAFPRPSAASHLRRAVFRPAVAAVVAGRRLTTLTAPYDVSRRQTLIATSSDTVYLHATPDAARF